MTLTLFLDSICQEHTSSSSKNITRKKTWNFPTVMQLVRTSSSSLQDDEGEFLDSGSSIDFDHDDDKDDDLDGELDRLESVMTVI
jgi:hypothetical protein